jgi:hypothetical protein
VAVAHRFRLQGPESMMRKVLEKWRSQESNSADAIAARADGEAYQQEGRDAMADGAGVAATATRLHVLHERHANLVCLQLAKATPHNLPQRSPPHPRTGRWMVALTEWPRLSPQVKRLTQDLSRQRVANILAAQGDPLRYTIVLPVSCYVDGVRPSSALFCGSTPPSH